MIEEKESPENDMSTGPDPPFLIKFVRKTKKTVKSVVSVIFITLCGAITLLFGGK